MFAAPLQGGGVVLVIKYVLPPAEGGGLLFFCEIKMANCLLSGNHFLPKEGSGPPEKNRDSPKGLTKNAIAFLQKSGYNKDTANELLEGGRFPMSNEFGSDFITITDEEGAEFELEHVDTLEWNDETYMAFFPADEAASDEDTGFDEEEYGLIILKVVLIDGEEQLSTLDSDEELETVYQMFMERILEDDEWNETKDDE